MLYKHWIPYYKKIITEIGIDEADDQIAASDYLENIKTIANAKDIIKNSINETKSRLNKNTILIFGAGPNLIDHLELLEKFSKINSNTGIISADGATKALFEFNLMPDIVVTDFDGHMESIVKVGIEGSIIYAHRHGDNRILVENWIKKIINLRYWVPTIQTKPFPPYLYNFGGFTDGDRALSIALEFTSPCKIILFGFEFGKLVGKYSKPNMNSPEYASEIKLKKLNFAKNFIRDLREKWYKEHEISIYSSKRNINSLF